MIVGQRWAACGAAGSVEVDRIDRVEEDPKVCGTGDGECLGIGRVRTF